MVGWHHRLDGHAFEQAPGVADGQGGLARCSPWGHKESDRTYRLNNEQQQKNEYHLTITTRSFKISFSVTDRKSRPQKSVKNMLRTSDHGD